ncbi:hypothetical protein AVEN_180659-1 [Araneus ventricosus]|uniref:DNA-directed DNA polymerase n=1 Tax=Araneus ventricosus TaxID=182803 RepID=A0A4Y2IE51_ARAVE|nr:hypothetical protein AVEN_180659-1 [Araneus ventricosus]
MLFFLYFQGCFFHGCPDCFDGDAFNPLLGLTMNTLFEETEALSMKLQKAGHVIFEKWEHEFLKETELDAELQKFVQSHELKEWLNPRDAFFGGRTNAVKLYYEGEAKYVDFTSLYPWIYAVYHFSESSTSLFKTYIDMFLKLKQESSGYPAECTTDVQKEEYINNYFEEEGVKLDAANISKNPGRRQVAKLALNSFWGRFGMKVNKTQLTYVHILPQFNKLLADPTKNIKDIYLPTEEVGGNCLGKQKTIYSSRHDHECFPGCLFPTTAWARLKLYSEIENLGDAVLYHDTDSIIYASNGKNDPPLGNFLGEFTDELDGETITTFISGK